jgi:HEAT repeat protein
MNRGNFTRRPFSGAAAGAGLALLALPAALFCAVDGSRAEAAGQEGEARALLAAVRGVGPVACELVVRSAGNGWGGGEGDDAPALARGGEDARRVLAWMGEEVSAADVAVLRAGLGDADACVRRVSARMLGRARRTGGVEALLDALRSGQPAQRDAAIVGLAHAGDERAVAPLSALLGDADPEVRGAAVWALGHTRGREASAAAARLTADREPRVRRAAAHALGRLDDSSSIPTLSRLLASDPDAGVRRAAAWALGRIE